VAEKADAVAREAAQLLLERACAGEVERQPGHLLAGGRERAQERLVALDRDQAADAQQARPGRGRRRLRAGGDPVVDDLERARVEALPLGEVLGEPARDRDLDVGEAGDGAVAEREQPAVAELVEAVLRREPHRNAREHGSREAVGVAVDEVGVDDSRPQRSEPPGHARERRRVEVEVERELVDRDAARAQLAREPGRTGLPLVEHVHLRPGDARHLLDVEDGRHRRAASTTASAQEPTEWDAATRSRSAWPSRRRSCGARRASPARRSASERGSSRSKRSSGPSRVSKAGFDATAGTQLAHASKTTLSVAPARMLLTSTSARANTSGTSLRRTAWPSLTRFSRSSSPTRRSSSPRWARSSGVSAGPYTSSRRSRPPSSASRTARSTVSSPFAGE